MKYTAMPMLLSLLLAPALAMDAEASNKIVGKPCLAKHKQIKAQAIRWTAFAANEANGAGQACGWAIGFTIKGVAIAGALRECRASEHDHPTWGKRKTCKIIFVQ